MFFAHPFSAGVKSTSVVPLRFTSAAPAAAGVAVERDDADALADDLLAAGFLAGIATFCCHVCNRPM